MVFFRIWGEINKIEEEGSRLPTMGKIFTNYIGPGNTPNLSKSQKSYRCLTVAACELSPSNARLIYPANFFFRKQLFFDHCVYIRGRLI